MARTKFALFAEPAKSWGRAKSTSGSICDVERLPTVVSRFAIAHSRARKDGRSRADARGVRASRARAPVVPSRVLEPRRSFRVPRLPPRGRVVRRTHRGRARRGVHGCAPARARGRRRAGRPVRGDLPAQRGRRRRRPRAHGEVSPVRRPDPARVQRRERDQSHLGVAVHVACTR